METTARNATLQDLVAVLESQHARKLDLVVPATGMRAVGGVIHVRGSEAVLTADGVTTANGAYRPTDVLDEGLSTKLDVPLKYLRRLRAQAPDLYDANINGWLHGRTVVRGGEREIVREADARSFMLRTFRPDDDGGEGIARALLSDRYGIIDHLDVLHAALSGIRDAGVNVHIDRADLTDRRMYVRVTAPEVSALAPELLKGYRSPFSGASGDELPVVFAGFVIANSEVGAGAYTITPQVIVQVCSNGMTRTADAMRAVHVGSKLEEGAISWSADTERKALDLIVARTRDAVASFLDVSYVERVVAEVTAQAGRALDAPADRVADVTSRLRFTEAERAGVLDHFVRGGQVTAGGLLQAVTSFSQTIEDADRAYEVEALGLRALELAAS